jgi:segregation and condensation protein B
MDKTKLKAVLECLLFMATEPLGLLELKKLLEMKAAEEGAEITQVEDETTVRLPETQDQPVQEAGEEKILGQLLERQSELQGEISKSEIKEVLEEISADYRDNPAKGFELVAVAKGYQFRTKLELAPYVRAFYKSPKPRISAPGMETLAIVAYQQPISRAKIEEVRGVDTGGVLKTLIDRDLVRVVGRSEEPGRPLLYGTTRTFLEIFNLQTLSDLPTLRDLEALESQQKMSITTGDQTVEENMEATEMESIFDATDNAWDEESKNLIEDLENSMKNLKSLEKAVFSSNEGSEEIVNPENEPKNECGS